MLCSNPSFSSSASSITFLFYKAACREGLRRARRPRAGLPGGGRGQALPELRRGREQRESGCLPLFPCCGEENVRAGNDGERGSLARLPGFCLQVCMSLKSGEARKRKTMMEDPSRVRGYGPPVWSMFGQCICIDMCCEGMG